MKKEDIVADIGQIRSMMVRSSKFMSINGLSGVLIGCYAIIGAGIAHLILTNEYGSLLEGLTPDVNIVGRMIFLGASILLLSIASSIYMAKLKAKKIGQSIWNPTSKALLMAVGLPLLTGGLFCIILLISGNFSLISSCLLIFYGLALAAGSIYTFNEVRVLGILEICLGLLALAYPEHGILFWALGFGVLHIIYGLIVHNKYEK